MQLDWFTSLAQVVNFLILVFLLQHFLYKPVVRAMDERENKIAARLEEAEKKRQEANETFENYRERLRELEEERDRRLNEIKEEMEEQRAEMLDSARSEIEEIKRKWEEDLKREHKNFLQSIRVTLGQEFGDVLRHLMSELAEANFENQMIKVFSERLNEISEKQKNELCELLQRSDGEVTIRSAFEMTEENRRLLTQTIHNNLFHDQKFDIDFTVTEDLIAGIELQVDGRRLAWTVEDYLDNLQSRIQQTLQEEFEKDIQQGNKST